MRTLADIETNSADGKGEPLVLSLAFSTPALTSSRFGPRETVQVAKFIVQVLTHLGDARVEEVRGEVAELTAGFPAPGLDDGQ